MDEASFEDFVAEVMHTIQSDDLDMDTKQSLVMAQYMDMLNLDASDDWHAKVFWWMLLKTGSIVGENFVPVKKGDDWLIDAVCHAAVKSFEMVVEQLHETNAHRYFSAKKRTKSLCRRVLALFDSNCKDLSVENCWYTVNLKNNILKAADLAKEFINFHKNQLHIPRVTKGFHRYMILCIFQTSLSGKYVLDDIGTPTAASNMQNSAEASHDDLVGLCGDLKEIKEQLTGTLSKLEIIPIVGMGGIGKTTLARRVYEDPQIICYFQVHAWTTVSKEYRERDVLLGLLQSIAPLTEEVRKEDKEKLAERLYKRLKGWRYFIVFDDIWSTEAWDQMKLCFPDDDNGSRIVLTSRITEVASYVSPNKPPHFMNFLGLEHSWDLLCKQVFGKEDCPPQLVNAGKQIAEKCQGLPLTIKVVGGHLSKINKIQSCWEEVAHIVGLPTEVTQRESLFNIFSLSFDNLPHYLKACFLSMVAFPKNYEIPVRKLVMLWTAMGLLPPKLPNNMEKVAMKCFDDLLSRSLVMVRERTFDGKVKSCGIHDLLWDLGLREAQKVGNYILDDSSLNHSYFNNDDMTYAMGLSHTLLYFDGSFQSDCPLPSAGFKKLNVLDIVNQCFDYFPDDITNLVNLRYLALATSSNIPDSVSKLCNLETLINNHVRAGPILPKGIWSLSHLRHLHLRTCTHLPDPPSMAVEGCCISMLPDLQTLSTLSSASCRKEVFLMISNLKELWILETRKEYMGDEQLFFSLGDLVYLHQLEKLKFCCNSKLEVPIQIPHWHCFVPNIKHLSLRGSHLPWSEMNSLTMLPNLEVLKLKEDSFVGLEWELDDGFPQLRCLLLESVSLMTWRANKDHFPNLQCLVIRNCMALSSLPADFGEIASLKLIDLEYCGTSIYVSARKIQIEQLNLGNEELIVRIGRVSNQQQLYGFVAVLVFMTLQMNRLWATKHRHKMKGKGAVRKTEVSTGD